MHLSRFDVDPRRRTAARWAASPHAMHAAVMRACNPEPGERVLWRLDRHTSFAELFVVSPREPHPEEILREATDGQPGAFATADYEPFLANIADGQCWRFRLTANPTYASSGSGSGSTRGKVRPHVSATHQVEWFRSQSERHGLSFVDESGLDTAAIVHREVRSFGGSRGDGEPPRRITLSVATIQGVLTVTDGAALRSALVSGIGRAKGYGCGLLTLAR